MLTSEQIQNNIQNLPEEAQSVLLDFIENLLQKLS